MDRKRNGTPRRRPVTAPPKRQENGNVSMQPWWNTQRSIPETNDYIRVVIREYDAPEEPELEANTAGSELNLDDSEDRNDECPEIRVAKPYVFNPEVLTRRRRRPVSAAPAPSSEKRTLFKKTPIYSSIVGNERFPPSFTEEELQPIVKGEQPLKQYNCTLRSRPEKPRTPATTKSRQRPMKYPSPPSLESRFKRIRNMRQKLVLRSAALAHKHQIRHPVEEEFRHNYEMKQERMEILNEQDQSFKTKVLQNIITNECDNKTEDKDLNSFAFGWDAITPQKSANSKVVWQNVAEHLEKSVLSRSEQVESTETAFKVLEHATINVDDEALQSSLRVVSKVLRSAVYNESGKTHLEEHTSLEDENAKLRAKLAKLEAEARATKVRLQELQREAESPFDQVRLGLKKLETMQGKRKLILELFDRKVVEADVETIVNLFSIFCSEEDSVEKPRTKEFFNRILGYVDEEDARSILSAIFLRDDIGTLFPTFMDKERRYEKLVLVKSRPMNRLIYFWEVHWREFCDILWYSSDLLPRIVSDRRDIIGKLLNLYSNWLGFGNRVHSLSDGNKVVLETLLNQVIDQQPAFLENVLLRNRQVLRGAFESDQTGEELIVSLAQSSPVTVGAMIDCSKSILPRLLLERSQLLNELLVKNPGYLLALARENIAVFARALNEGEVVAEACKNLPALMDRIVATYPDELANCVASSTKAVVSVLRHVPTQTLNSEVFLEHPDILVKNQSRLEDLGLLNVETYHSNCHAKIIQTDPVYHVPGAGIKARPLFDIVGKRILKKTGPTNIVWTEDNLSKAIAKIYQNKVTADSVDDKAGHAREPFSEVAYDYFVSEAPDTASAKRNLSAFIQALRPICSDSPLLYWFCVLAGVTTKHEEFNANGIDFFMSLLTSMIPCSDVEDCLLVSDEEGTAVVPVEQAVTATVSVASMYWYEEETRAIVVERIKGLERYKARVDSLVGDHEEKKTWSRTNEIVPPNAVDRKSAKKMIKHVVNTKIFRKDRLASEILSVLEGGKPAPSFRQSRLRANTKKAPKTVECVPILHVIDVVMDEWFAFEKSQSETLVDLFNKSDTNGDGILDYNEFKAMVMVVDPCCEERTVLRMFKMTGQETDEGDHVISPHEFIEVCRIHKFYGPALAHLMEKDEESEEEQEGDEAHAEAATPNGDATVNAKTDSAPGNNE